ncbi:MAG: Minf_1886 family protein [Planctomycetia bacterium]
MPLVDPSHPLAHLLARDRRYPLDAYLFILEALSFAQDTLGLGEEPPAEELEPIRGKEGDPAARSKPKAGRSQRRRSERHLTGQELCEAARHYALQQYGYMARIVLATWGLKTTDDFGELVFNMIDIGQMRKTRHDKREDFHGVYDFAEAFTRDVSFVAPEGG